MTDDRRRDERCACGNLVAKVTSDGVEILCRRCKRVHRIPWRRADVERMSDEQKVQLKG